MGASESSINQYPVVKDFEHLIKVASSPISTDLLKGFNNFFEKLKQSSENLFITYEKLIDSNKLGGEGIDINLYFSRIDIAIKAFEECANYIKLNSKKPETPIISANFRNNLRKFLKQLTQFSSLATNILESLNTKVSPSMMTLFFIELSLFDFALNIRKSDKPPFYSMHTASIYDLREELHDCNQNFANIIAPHGSGKTCLVPIHLTCRSLENFPAGRFIIVVEHDTSSIHHIKNIYRRICCTDKDKMAEAEGILNDNDNDENDTYEYDIDDPTAQVTSTLSDFINFYTNPIPFYPVIGIFSPIDTLRLIHTINNLTDFVTKSTFVIDDVNMRTVATDVLVQDLTRAIERAKISRKDNKLILMSTVPDLQIIRCLGRHKELKGSDINSEVPKKDIPCSSISDIRNHKLFRKMHDFFDTWIEKSDISIGSVVVFVPSEKVGQRLYKEIYKHYSKDNSTTICPLPTTIKKGETTDEFYNRLLADLILAENDRKATDEHGNPRETDPILFLMPMNISGHISQEEKALIRSQLPIPFIDKLSRVFITTNKNDSLLQIDDLMVIFDTGIEEVEFYDPKQSVIHVREQLLPKPFMESHHKLLGNLGDGIYFEFRVRNVDRPKELIPSVKRGDLGREILILRNFGINFEEQRNLPSEPNRELLDECFSTLISIGIIENTREKRLTEIGKLASKFATVSPFYALATAKYNQNHQFAFLCSLLIEDSRSLVINSQSKLLCRHFCRDSDVVTLLESLCELSEDAKVEQDDHGLSIGMIYSIYNAMSTTFDNCNGRESVINAVKWARSQPGGTFQCVDQFVLLLPQEQFINKRKGTFVHVLGAGPGSEPTLIYRANDIFKFTDKSTSEDDFAKIKFAKRPGWLGLQSPGNIIALSLLIEEDNKVNRGLIIHRDTRSANDNPGVVGFAVNNPSLNSFFFVSLFEGYWSDHKASNDFIGIYHTPVPNKESAFLIHMTSNDDQTFLNYCPRNNAIENTMNSAIPVLSSLMPFVPRSVLAKVDVPLCAVEINGNGTSQHYTTNVHLITEPDSDLPFPYPVNKATLEYAARNINELMKTLPLIRFAITGECFYYKSIRGREVETDLSYPDVNPSVLSVFDSHHPTHLVLLVDKHFPNKPPVPPLAWIPAAGKEATVADTTDTQDNKDLVKVASKIMSSFGYAERSADLFFVTLGGGFPSVSKGTVPNTIRSYVGYSEGENNAIKLGIYPLVKYFIRDFSVKQNLEEPIPLEELGSTDAWRNYPRDERTREKLCDDINNAMQEHFHVKEVQSYFFGTSMIGIRIDGLPEDLVCHVIKGEAWNTDYQPCKADFEITNVLRSIKTVPLDVTQVIHEPTINVCVRHMRRFAVDSDEFKDKVYSVAKKFGFLRAALSDYNKGATDLDLERMGVLGDVQIELIGMPSGIAFSSVILDQFPSKSLDDFDMMTSTMATCRGMATIRPDLGSPEVLLNQKLVKISPSEIDALKQEIAARFKGADKRKWTINEDFNVLIVPANNEAALDEMMRNIRNKDEDTTCLFLCDPPQQFLPQSLYVYMEDRSVRTYAICKQCMIEAFRGMEDFQAVIDPVTQMVDRNKLKTLSEALPGIPLIADGTEKNGVAWPQIPLGQALFILMCEPEILGTDVKSWFTAIIDFIIRMARNYFTYCPNHPDIPHRVPKPGSNLKCPYCNFMFCATCRTWHSMDRCPGLMDLPGVKRCPNCNTPTYKYDGCNHITCRCGKHWCYKCDKSPIFNTGNECYSHLSAVHGGYNT
ncbi:hypothetical protein M9Y10_016210 [Tritrichomonas musculus]|uniref:RING-type domain-containing protein n=1 Tax=Tritrichomonas musculus TaxID=1915356 RepID=A0ABR2I5K8_9EUKA